jgi:hypothetical protein
MAYVRSVLLLAGFICLLLSSFEIHFPKLNLQSLGLTLWIVSELVFAMTR